MHLIPMHTDGVARHAAWQTFPAMWNAYFGRILAVYVYSTDDVPIGLAAIQHDAVRKVSEAQMDWLTQCTAISEVALQQVRSTRMCVF
jgi:hypothetical protein